MSFPTQHVRAVALALLASFIASPLVAQTTDTSSSIIYACYVPSSGTMYRIRTPDGKQACSGPGVEFSWNALGLQGIQGPVGPEGPKGEKGDPGTSSTFTLPYAGSTSFTGSAFKVTNTDGGLAGHFVNTGTGNALHAQSVGTGSTGNFFNTGPTGPALFAQSRGTDSPTATFQNIGAATAVVGVNNSPNRSAGAFYNDTYLALYAESRGTGPAFLGISNGVDATVQGENRNATGAGGAFRSVGVNASLNATNNASGPAFFAKSSSGSNTANFQNLGSGSAVIMSSIGGAPSMTVQNTGNGPGMKITANGGYAAGHFENSLTATGNVHAILARSAGAFPTVQIERLTPGVALRAMGDADVHGNFSVFGNSVVTGAKNAIVPTKSGMRKMYSEESSEVWFSEYGEGRLENGVAKIAIDRLFGETVDLTTTYHVFVQPYASATVYVAKRTPRGFEVRIAQGDSTATFSYRLVAKRRGYASERLEKYEGPAATSKAVTITPR